MSPELLEKLGDLARDLSKAGAPTPMILRMVQCAGDAFLEGVERGWEEAAKRAISVFVDQLARAAGHAEKPS